VSEVGGVEFAPAPRHRSTLGVKRIEEEREDEDDHGYEAHSSGSRREGHGRDDLERRGDSSAAEPPAKRKEGKSRGAFALRTLAALKEPVADRLVSLP
jgi:hypothetical protein